MSGAKGWRERRLTAGGCGMIELTRSQRRAKGESRSHADE